MATQHALHLGHEPRSAIRSLAKGWGWTLLRGFAAIAFGVLALVWPGLTLLTLLLLFAAYVLADGVFALVAAVTGRDHGLPTWWLVLIGLLGAAIAAVTFFWPGVTALVLVMIIGAWALVRGVFEIIASIQLWKELEDAWILTFSGIVSVIFGGAILAMPGAGALALVWLIGTYAIVFGITLVVLSFRLRKISHTLSR